METYTVTRIDRDGLGGWKYGTRPDGSIKWIEERVDGGEILAALLAAHPPHYGHVIRRNFDGAQLAPDGFWIPTSQPQEGEPMNEKAEEILDGLAANGFDVRGSMRVERPADRGREHRWGTDDASAFLASWCRVVAADGSTVAYTPDETTARLIAEALGGAR